MCGLTAIEKMLVCLAKPLSIYKSRSSSYSESSGYQFFEKILPHKIMDVQLAIEEITEEGGFSQEWVVRSWKVREAVLWLIKNNKYYHDVVISEDNLQSLPNNGVIVKKKW